MTSHAKRAVVLVSGGLDSATVLAMAKKEGYECYALSFDYGQRHKAELKAAANIASRLGAVMHRILKLPLDDLGGSALTDKTIPVPAYSGSTDIPITYVPARNLIFLSFATAWAELLNAEDIFIGASSIDYSGYPDCRPAFFQAFEKVATLGTKVGDLGNTFRIHAPLSHLSKAETIKIGIALDVPYQDTISCYQATEKGEACGMCDSCSLRKKGFLEAGVSDPTLYSGR